MAGTPYSTWAQVDAAAAVVPLPPLSWTDVAVAVALARPKRTLPELKRFQSQAGQRVRRRQPDLLAEPAATLSCMRR